MTMQRKYKSTLVSLGLLTVVGVLLLPLVRRSAQETSNAAATKVLTDAKSEANPITVSPEPSHVAQLLTAAASLENAPEHTEEIAHAAGSVADSDLLTALESLKTTTNSAAIELRDALVRRWATQAPVAAVDWANQLPAEAGRGSALQQAVLAWSELDLNAALDWVKALPADATKTALTLDLAYEATRSDAVLALQLAAPLPVSAERDVLLTHALSEWAESDHAAAQNWITSITDTALQQRLTATLATVLAKTQPAQAASLVSQSLSPGQYQNQAALTVIQQWAQTAPTTAAQWLIQFPEGSLKNQATQQLLTLWTKSDATAAGDWVAQLPVGDYRIQANAAYQTALKQIAVLNAAHAADATDLAAH